MNKEFRTYIRMLISEIVKENNLPTASQLVSSDKDKGESSQDDEDDLENECGLEEFSGAGAIAGFSLPLGMSPDQPVAGSKTRKKNKKRKSPSWA
jgi:hypothetical protein